MVADYQGGRHQDAIARRHLESMRGAGQAEACRLVLGPVAHPMHRPCRSFLTIPGKAPNLPVQLPRDFTAIGLTAEQPMSIGINPKLGINTLPELISQAKKRTSPRAGPSLRWKCSIMTRLAYAFDGASNWLPCAESA